MSEIAKKPIERPIEKPVEKAVVKTIEASIDSSKDERPMSVSTEGKRKEGGLAEGGRYFRWRHA